MYHIIDFSSYIICENKYVDSALDKLNQVGSFKNLPELDKLALLSNADDTPELKKISLIKLYNENGGEIDSLTIKVRIKDLSEQPIKHKFSVECAGEEGWISHRYIFSDDAKRPYVTVRFPEFKPDPMSLGGGRFKELPIMLHNLYPIGYGEVSQEFINHYKKVEQERKKFRKGWDDIE